MSAAQRARQGSDRSLRWRWLECLRDYRAAHPGLSFAQAVAEAELIFEDREVAP